MMLVLYFLVGWLILHCFQWIDSTAVTAQELTRTQAIQISDECIQSIKKIRQGECNIRFHIQDHWGKDGTFTKQFNIKFEGEKSLIVGTEHDRTMAYAFNCYKDGTFVYFTTRSHNMIGPPPPKELHIQNLHTDFLEIFPFTPDFGPSDGLFQLKYLLDTREYSIPSPHLLCQIGMVPATTPNVHYGNLEIYFAPLKNNRGWKNSEGDALFDNQGGFFNLQVAEEVFEDSSCNTVSWCYVEDLMPDGMKICDENGIEITGPKRIDRLIERLRPGRQKVQVKIWFDKKCGNLVRKIILDSKKAEKTADTRRKSMSVSLSNTLHQDPSSGIWYPSSWIYLSRLDGDKYMTEEGMIKYISINKSWAQDVFSLESIDALKPDCPVKWNLDSLPPGNGKLIWDGKRVVGMGLDMDAMGHTQRNKRIAIVVLINILIISGLALLRIFRSRNKK